MTVVVREDRELDSGVVTQLTLNRPEARNAIDQAVVDGLRRHLDDLAGEERTRCMVLTGAGEKAFAAGADIGQLKTRGRDDALRRINAALFRELEEHPVVSIAAVRGYALGGGCELAMACDLRVAGVGSKWGQPEVGLGIVAGAGAIQRLPALVGLGKARELLYTGRILGAEEAERIGLVNQVVADADVLDAAHRMADTIAAQGGLAVRLTKTALNASARPHPAFESIDVLAQAVLFETDDKHARMQAFLDRKKKR
ncbi:MAG: enoyl-CoA hydratase-related protein [Myxococcota bacterium]